MSENFSFFGNHQVFLNYPYDSEFEDLADAMHFAVISAGLLPVCAKDINVTDKPRLLMLVDTILKCKYSAHDFSRSKGEGEDNLARFNMPFEMGIAYGQAHRTQGHCCTFFVSEPHDYHKYISDLSGLDPTCHFSDDLSLVSQMYEWLRKVVPGGMFNSVTTIEMKEKYQHFKSELQRLKGSGANFKPTHSEKQELMCKICEKCGWWDWRANKAGKEEFPVIPLSWK